MTGPPVNPEFHPPGAVIEGSDGVLWLVLPRACPKQERLFTERDVQSLVNYATGEQVGEHLDIDALIKMTANMGHPLDETMHGDLMDEWKVTHATGWPDPVHFDGREKAISFHAEHGGLLWHRWVTEWTEA
jgi:hypothetical protein